MPFPLFPVLIAGGVLGLVVVAAKKTPSRASSIALTPTGVAKRYRVLTRGEALGVPAIAAEAKVQPGGKLPDLVPDSTLLPGKKVVLAVQDTVTNNVTIVFATITTRTPGPLGTTFQGVVSPNEEDDMIPALLRVDPPPYGTALVFGVEQVLEVE